jgi:hypothetical protein
MIRNTVVLAVALLVTAAAFAQTDAKKPLSPPATAKGVIGGTEITVDYSAPSKRDRVIMGGLVPYDKVWRTGANAATTITTTGDLMLGDLHLPAGKYSLFTIPGEKEWTLIVNKQTGHSGARYDESQDFGRVKMSVKPLKDTLETFTISVKPAAGKKGTLLLAWENTEASIPVTAH